MRGPERSAVTSHPHGSSTEVTLRPCLLGKKGNDSVRAPQGSTWDLSAAGAAATYVYRQQRRYRLCTRCCGQKRLHWPSAPSSPCGRRGSGLDGEEALGTRAAAVAHLDAPTPHSSPSFVPKNSAHAR
jgi:hypothetical protein